MRVRTNLDGLWEFVTEGGDSRRRAVPSSHHWMGRYTYRREFEAEARPGRRILLCFDGLATEGALFLNGAELGEMEPYVEYRFDVTDLIRPEKNIIEVRMRDIGAGFAAYNGWSHYAGICRSVCLLDVSDPYMDDVYFHYSFPEGYGRAQCTAEVTLAGAVPPGASLRAVLEGADAQAAAVAANGKTVLEFSVRSPRLWSPDSPELYRLSVFLEIDGETADETVLQVGFKDFCVREKRFFLNGAPVFLFGVCRHDLQGDGDGFTQTDAQIEKDMRMIKETGANYVRLVHYPHDKRVLDWADRLGLLVSGEPGFWWSNLLDGEMVERGREVMRRLVLRDRSRVSVAFWLTFNECVLTPEFIREMVETVRACDALRPVSGANCMDIASTKKLFDENGFDFYTYHPYGYDPTVVTGGVSEGHQWKEGWKSIDAVADYLCDKPLVFTEWGGHYVGGNPALFSRFCGEFRRLGRAGKLAGAAYWVFADYYEFNRPRPSNVDGVTIEGLVDMERNPRENLTVFARAAKNCEKPPEQAAVKVFPVGDEARAYCPISLDCLRAAPEQEAAWEYALKQAGETARLRSERIHVPHSPGVNIGKGPVLPSALCALGPLEVRIPEGRPLTVNEGGGALSLPLQVEDADALYVIGHASFIYGYPSDGEFGELLGEYRLAYADGTEQVVPLRNGLEIASAHKIYINTRVEPSAGNTEKAFDICHDPSFETYGINALEIPLRGSVLTGFTAVSRNPMATLLIYGLSARKRIGER